MREVKETIKLKVKLINVTLKMKFIIMLTMMVMMIIIVRIITIVAIIIMIALIIMIIIITMIMKMTKKTVLVIEVMMISVSLTKETETIKREIAYIYVKIIHIDIKTFLHLYLPHSLSFLYLLFSPTSSVVCHSSSMLFFIMSAALTIGIISLQCSMVRSCVLSYVRVCLFSKVFF